MRINAVEPQTYSTAGVAVLLALFNTVTNLKINSLAPLPWVTTCALVVIQHQELGSLNAVSM